MTGRVEQAAERLKALGHPVRLAILRRVVQGPEAGTPAGELQSRLDIPASTLSHHLATLADAGLVQVAREGTTLRYRADFGVLHALTDYIWQDCCAGGAADPLPPSPCCDRD
ncbi:ArsR/SmtB family transcription factor [Geothrix campi]|uniref:ArsR/SmtB family transcription factor n=1 Tax=Geothrix campi TaxID=2966450 RepID=UPI002147A373|nr:metalloregulator ArsR/SmtB family transcription factor [Geothrix sp. SG10]